MRLLNGSKFDPIIFRILNSDLLLLLLFSTQFRVYIYFLDLIVSGHHKSSHQGLFQSRVNINKGITRHVNQTIHINKTSYLPHFVCVCVGEIISLPWFFKELKTTYRRTTNFVASSLYFSFANQYSLGGGFFFQQCWCLGTSYLCVTLLSNLIRSRKGQIQIFM